MVIVRYLFTFTSDIGNGGIKTDGYNQLGSVIKKVQNHIFTDRQNGRNRTFQEF